MLWKETGLTAPAEAQGRYPITIAALEAAKQIGVIPPVPAPIGVRPQGPLPIEVPAALLQDLQVEPTEALLLQGHQVEPTEAVPVVPLPDRQVVHIEAPAAPTVPVEVLEVLAVLLQDHHHQVAEAAEDATKKHGPLFQ
jgi:hypothetical protein